MKYLFSRFSNCCLIVFLYVYSIQDDGIEINFCIYECYKDLFLPLMWIGIQLLYMVLIQIALFILAIVNRNVSLKIMNDFKSISVIIYTTTVVLFCLGVITFAITSYVIVTEVIFLGGILLDAAILLSFTFIPKVSPLNILLFIVNDMHTFIVVNHVIQYVKVLVSMSIFTSSPR